MPNLAYVASASNKSVSVAKTLLENLDMQEMQDNLKPDIIVVIGGDGELLHALHRYMHLNVPFYGINTGSIGFLMNNYASNDLVQRKIDNAIATTLRPLSMIAYGCDGKEYKATAINEVSIFRSTNQSAKFNIKVDDVERLSDVVADGILVSTPAGSSAYNFSAGGQIVPLDSNVLCMTPICPFRPRRWQGAILPHHSAITFEILESDKRPVNATADFIEVSNIARVTISESKSESITLLFDNGHSLEDRVIKEQFLY